MCSFDAVYECYSIDRGVLYLQQEQGHAAEKTVQKSSTGVTPGKVTKEEGLPTQERTDLHVTVTEDRDAATGSTIFTQIHQLIRAGPSTPLIEVSCNVNCWLLHFITPITCLKRKKVIND